MSAFRTEPPARLAEIRALNQHLVSAQDAKILKVVAMVDSLPVRGEADNLIASLRPRLAQLRPRRPMNAVRLLLIPIDLVMVVPTEWRRGALSIPRTAAICLARQFADLDPALMAEVMGQIGGATTDDRLVVGRVGSELWASAAARLSGTAPPADWNVATGLSETDHRAICDAVVLVLRHAPAISRMAEADTPNAKVIAEILTHAATQPEAMGVLISVLLQWVPGAAPHVLSVTSAHAAPTGLPGRAATERAVEHVLEGIEAEQDGPQDSASALPRLRRTVAMLDELQAGSADRPTRTARIAATRAKVDSACRDRFQAQLQETVANRLAGGLPQESADIVTLEAAARDIRRFENVARRISGSDHYDRQLRTTIATLLPRSADDNESRVDRLRLAEILLGPEQALQMLLDAGNNGRV